DISYIHTEQGVLYLSMIRDLYDNSIVAYKTAAQQTVNLVLDTIRLAMKKEKVAGELHLHSDQGFQYTSHGYFKLTQSYGITPSMSRRGNCYDNAMAENFFSILKTECIYRQKLKTFQQANDLIDEYIHFYDHERLQTKTGLAPLSRRQARLGFACSTLCRPLLCTVRTIWGGSGERNDYLRPVYSQRASSFSQSMVPFGRNVFMASRRPPHRTRPTVSALTGGQGTSRCQRGFTCRSRRSACNWGGGSGHSGWTEKAGRAAAAGCTCRSPHRPAHHGP